MPAPFTIVTLVDDDGDEFPIRLPGVWKDATTRGLDIETALKVAEENVAAGAYKPTGELRFDRIEYQDAAVMREP